MGSESKTAARGAFAAVAAATITLAAAGPLAAAELRVCFRDDDLPRAERTDERGFDIAVLRTAASELGLELRPVWLPPRPPFTEIEGTDLPLASLVRGDCDAVASVGGEVALGPFADRLALTVPYYGATFELVVTSADDGDPSAGGVDDLRGRVVGVRLQSLAHFALERLGIAWRASPSTAEVLAALDAGEVDAVLVWGPSLATFDRRPVAGFRSPVALRFNEHVALRRDDVRRGALDAALARLLERGEIGELAAAAGMVVHAPFEEPSGPGALRSLTAQGAQPLPAARVVR
jgi:ABC-type amino acid transport substrate-binding protein